MAELISHRTESSKTFDLGGQRRGLDCSIGAIHYKDNYADTKELWKDIDLTWEGNRITRAPYELTLEGNKVTVKDKKTGEISTIELLEIGGILIPPQAWERSKGLAKAFATDLEVVAGNGSVSFARILKSSQAAVEAKYKVTGKIPLRIRARDEEGELPVEWTIKDGILTETLKPDRPIKYPVRIDPTVDVSVVAGADDGWAHGTTFYDAFQMRAGREGSENIRAFARFTGVTIPADAIIGANCYASLFVWSSTQPGVYLKVKADDSANPDAPTNATEVFAITPTTAGVDWDDQADVDDWANSPDIQSVIAELQASYDYSSGAALIIIIDNDGSANDERLYARDWDYNDHSKAPKLHIEYSVGGVTHYGAATLSGVGTLAGIGRGIFIGKSTLSGIGTLAAIGRGIFVGAATLAGTGTLSALGGLLLAASATLSGIGSLSAIAGVWKLGAATLSGVGSLAAKGVGIFTGKAILTGVGSLAAAGRGIFVGSATLAGTGTLAAIGLIVAVGRLLKVVAITSQYRGLNIITAQNRLIKPIMAMYRKVK